MWLPSAAKISRLDMPRKSKILSLGKARVLRLIHRASLPMVHPEAGALPGALGSAGLKAQWDIHE